MTVGEMKVFFLTRGQRARIMAYRSKSKVIIKCDYTDEAKHYFETSRPDTVKFVYRRFGFWDAFVCRKELVRTELR